MRGLRAMAVAVALVAGLAAGCARDDGSAGTAPSSSATPSGLTQMQKKVAAAESALAQADRDAAQDADR
ncbi:hypothetical protein ABZV31_31790 [Streptomyces sp. NPDC005202]|uniref:hypothetical protein n=1 Tax=Streptomyces sp. NPDC005202 TaxID=3157021 RepID=UPI0033B61FB6